MWYFLYFGGNEIVFCDKEISAISLNVFYLAEMLKLICDLKDVTVHYSILQPFGIIGSGEKCYVRVNLKL